jgi:hypothetical protein
MSGALCQVGGMQKATAAINSGNDLAQNRFCFAPQRKPTDVLV